MWNRKLQGLLLFTLLGLLPSKAQDFWVEFDWGVVERTETFPLPEGSNFPIETKMNGLPLITLGVAARFAHDYTAYAKTGYGTLSQQLSVGPLVRSNGVPVPIPLGQPFLHWEGFYSEAGFRFALIRGTRAELAVGAGFGHAYNYANRNLSSGFPFDLFDGEMYSPGLFSLDLDAQLNGLHAFFAVPQVQFTFFGRKHQRPYWVKAALHQGLTDVVQGEFVYVRELAPDDSIEREFSFSFVRRLSFFSVGIGVGLFHFRLGEPDPSELY